MKNEEFLAQLERLLQGKMPPQEIQNVMEYHREYFAEAGENAAAELDPPDVIAQRVLDEYFSPPPSRFPKWAKPAAICAGLVVVGLLLVRVGTHQLFGSLGNWRDGTVTEEETVTAIDQVIVTEDLQPGAAIQNGDHMMLSTALPELESIVIEGVSDNVTIVTGNRAEYILEMGYASRENLDYSVKDGTLYIVGELENVFSIGYEPGEITVVVPAWAEFSWVSVKAEMGDVFLEKVNAQSAELETDLGNVSVTEGAYGSLDCESDMGDVLVTDVTADMLKCSSDSGNVDAISFTAKETELDADLGGITAIAAGRPEDYALELEVDLGEIRLNGMTVSSPYHSQGRDAGKSIKATADTGGVILDFAGDTAGAITEE